MLLVFNQYPAPALRQPLVTASETCVRNMDSLDPHGNPINRGRESSRCVDEGPEDRRREDFPKVMKVHAWGSQGSNLGSLVFLTMMPHRPAYNVFVIEKDPMLPETAPPSPFPSAPAQTELRSPETQTPGRRQGSPPQALFIHLTLRTFSKVTFKMQSGVFTAALRGILQIWPTALSEPLPCLPLDVGGRWRASQSHRCCFPPVTP